MQLLYNSDSFAVLRFDDVAPDHAPADGGAAARPALRPGGFEIVDKFARREIFIQGALAERFQQGVQALVDQGPTQEALDEFISGFAGNAQQPVVLH